MLNARNLDDQTYEQIVDNAEGRLPWVCPEWTNHNASDPGITFLELMAWYKELQQYHLNKLTDAMRRKLLKLAGITPEGPRPARCGLRPEPERRGRPALTRLYTTEGIPFELEERLPDVRPVLKRAEVAAGDRSVDVTPVIRDRRVTFTPFLMDAGRGALRLGFSETGGDTLRLWFSVAAPEGAARNPFGEHTPDPRVIRWRCVGAQSTEVTRDDTHALSVSGEVSIRHTGDWPAGEDGLHWLMLELTDPGCEEEVRLEAVYEDMVMATQRETWAGTHFYNVEPVPGAKIEINNAQASIGIPALFLRVKGRWEESEDWIPTRREDGITIEFDASGADAGGAEHNVMVVSLDVDRASELLFDAKGLPGETFFLGLEGRTVIPERFTLLCNTLMEDGTVSPELWHRVDDFYHSGPADRVFTYDRDRETVTFGDGEHGALLMGGHGAVLAAEMTVTYCAGGSIPEDAGLWFDDDGRPVEHTDAFGGSDGESLDEAQARLIRMLNTTRRCVSAEDYERLAKSTPGLRIRKVRALPGYDPEDPAGVSRFPVVTVVAVPEGRDIRPTPDGRFLETVRRELDSVRPIGVRIHVMAPVYVDIDVSVSLRGAGDGAEEHMTEGLREYFDKVGIGGTVSADDVAAIAQASPGTLQVRNVRLRTPSAGCVQTSDGNIRLPRAGSACLRRLEITRQDARGGKE